MSNRFRSARLATAIVLVTAVVAPCPSRAQDAPAKRPMTFLDVQHLEQIGAPRPSPDGQWLLYTLSTPDWKEARRQSDVYVVSIEKGVESTRQLTFSKDKNETQPTWARDGSFFVYASNRDAPSSKEGQNQLYLMRIDGGEGRRITDAKEGVSTFAFSRDGAWLVYRSGKAGEEQLYRLPVKGIEDAKAEQLTKHEGAVGAWRWSPDSRRIYFAAPERRDADEKQRRDKKFTVEVRNAETPLESLWSLDLESKKIDRLTSDSSFSVLDFEVSDDGRWVGFRGVAADRYKRNVTEEGIYANPYLLETATGRVEALLENDEVGESLPRVSPDGRYVAFSAPDDLTQYSMKNQRVYLRPIGDRGGKWRKLGASFDGDAGIDFWSKDGNTIYFNEGWKATTQLFALDVAKDVVRPLTNEKATVSVDRDDDSGVLLIDYSDGTTPRNVYRIASPEQAGTRDAWRLLVSSNPQVRGFALGEQEEITWKAKDGRMVGGVLVKPVGFEAGKRYPLIVAIHGGPAGADVLRFNGGYGSQVYAGAGYVVLMPNYRGSTNYGEAHKTGIVGNYFPPGFDDIMSGVDHLIAQGIVDGSRMGALGWSAGGHWSNWILTHTDRFKAISSGAGTSNWISMYAQSDVQRNRQYYLGNKLPYDDFEPYWAQSPIRYVKNAKTPTMIHVVEGDPRVPSPQSVELHMALKRLGVPTELFMYPGQSHGIPDQRNQLVKAVSEMAWMDYYVRGVGKKFSWRMVLETLPEEGEEKGAEKTEKK